MRSYPRYLSLRPMGMNDRISSTRELGGWGPRLAGFRIGIPITRIRPGAGATVPTARARPICLNAGYCSSEVRHLWGGRGRRLDRARLGVEVPEAPPGNAEPGQHRHREKHPRGAGEDAEEHQAGVELDPAPHDQGARHVVLRETPRQD